MTITINGTTGISGVDGSAGTPAVQGTDTNTGVFYPAADTVGVSTGGSERMRVDSSGNLLIGTTTNTGVDTGSQRLVVNGIGSNGAALGVIADTVGRGIRVTDSSKTYTAIYDMTTSLATLGTNQSIPLAFITVGSERMRIDSSGNLLVGTTATALGNIGCQMFPTGYYQATCNGAPAMILKRGSNDGAILDFYDSAGNRRGYVNVTTSATTYNTISDYRLKENVTPMTNALAKVQALKPVTYTWKANGSSGQGFIAHELQSVIPDCVVGQKDATDADGNPDYQGIDTSFLVATLTAAIQEQQALITALTARIEALETK